MTRTDVTYGQLDKVLRSLGFSCRADSSDPPARVYEHGETGAWITLPPFPGEDRVLDYHLALARTTLAGFGISDSTTFDAQLRRAG